MYEIEKAKIKQLLGKDIYNMFKEAKCILAGGAITSLFTNKEISDFDTYFTSEESLSSVFGQIFGVVEEDFIAPYDLIAKFATKRSMLCVSRDRQKVQLIHYKIHENVQSVFDSFDFEHVMGAFDFATEEFVLHENFLKSNSQRLMQFNPGTDFPITSMMRVQKYKERGYTISKTQMLRIAFTIADHKYDSWEKVKSEVSGLYGIAPEDLFDETKPFSLEEVVLQLDKVILNDKYVNTNQPTFEECVELMKHNFSDNFNAWYSALEQTPSASTWYTQNQYNKAQRNKYSFENMYNLSLGDGVNNWLTKPVENKKDDELDDLF